MSPVYNGTPMLDGTTIGILSDTHGHWADMERAMKELIGGGARVLVHCGDIGSIQCMRLLGEVGLEAYAVAGNMDCHIPHLAETAASVGVTFHPRSVEVPITDGQFLVATHGHIEHLLDELLAGEQFPYVCFGHTHRRHDQHVGRTHVINPGAVVRADPPTVALLDIASDQVRFLDL